MHINTIKFRMIAKEGPFEHMSAAHGACSESLFGGQLLDAQNTGLMLWWLLLQDHVRRLTGTDHSALSCCGHDGCRSPGARRRRWKLPRFC